MLENQSGTSDVLARIEAARAPIETPSEASGDSEEAAPVETPNEAVSVEESESAETLEASEEAESVDEQVEEGEADDLEDIYDLNGRELSLSQITEWEQGYLRQSDYTRKTQKLAEDRKSVEAERAALSEKQTALDERIAELSVLVEEMNSQDFDGLSLDELREVDPAAYLKHKELMDKRATALDQAKKTKGALSEEDEQAQQRQIQSDLLKANPQWVEDGKMTDAYQKDTEQALEYMKKLGFTESDQNMMKSAKLWQMLLDASRADQVATKNEVAKKKVKKAPVITKPGSKAKSSSQSALEKARADHKKYGTPETAMRLRKAQRAANN